MIFNKNLPTSMRAVGAKVVRAFASVLHKCTSSVRTVFTSQQYAATTRAVFTGSATKFGSCYLEQHGK